MTSRELSAWLRYMGGQELYDEVYDQFGVQGFINGDTGTQAGGWFRKELTGVADIQGLKFRTPGLGGQVWEKMGASVVNMAAGRDLRRAAVGRARRRRVRRPLQRSRARLLPGRQALLSVELHRAGPRHRARGQQGQVHGAARRPAGHRRRSPARPNTIRSPATSTPTTRRRWRSLVKDHGVITHQFPDEILEAGAKAASEILDDAGQLRRRPDQEGDRELSLLARRPAHPHREHRRAVPARAAEVLRAELSAHRVHPDAGFGAGASLGPRPPLGRQARFDMLWLPPGRFSRSPARRSPARSRRRRRPRPGARRRGRSPRPPAGRRRRFSSGARNPVRMSRGGPAGRPFSNGTKITL